MKWKTPNIGRKVFIILGLAIALLVAGPAIGTVTNMLGSGAPDKIISPEAVVREIGGLALEFLKETLKRYRDN